MTSCCTVMSAYVGLSKGRVLKSVSTTRRDILAYQRAQTFLYFVNDCSATANVHFLCDVTSCLNQLNLHMQGKKIALLLTFPPQTDREFQGTL